VPHGSSFGRKKTVGASALAVAFHVDMLMLPKYRGGTSQSMIDGPFPHSPFEIDLSGSDTG